MSELVESTPLHEVMAQDEYWTQGGQEIVPAPTFAERLEYGVDVFFTSVRPIVAAYRRLLHAPDSMSVTPLLAGEMLPALESPKDGLLQLLIDRRTHMGRAPGNESHALRVLEAIESQANFDLVACTMEDDPLYAGPDTSTIAADGVVLERSVVYARGRKKGPYSHVGASALSIYTALRPERRPLYSPVLLGEVALGPTTTMIDERRNTVTDVRISHGRLLMPNAFSVV